MHASCCCRYAKFDSCDVNTNEGVSMLWFGNFGGAVCGFHLGDVGEAYTSIDVGGDVLLPLYVCVGGGNIGSCV